MKENTKLYLDLLKSLAGLLGSIASLGLMIVATIKAVHGQYAEATFLLIIILVWRVFELGGRK